MPRPTLPPTPASSTDLKGQEQQNAANNIQFQTFELPPPAMTGESVSVDKDSAGTKPTYTVPPSETVKSRRRSSAAQSTPGSKDAFALPPPPTRSRKIIHMKPRQEESSPPEPIAPAAKSNASKKGAASTSAGEAGSTSAGKKKQPSATSAAGRKIARKTAHSLIERRRRSKMNEEFSVLKSLIPACTGEMHKLAILQASIEYVRYLEECVQQLKANQQTYQDNPASQPPTPAAHDTSQSPTEPTPQARPYNPARTYTNTSEDIDMTDSEAQSPYASAASSVHQPSVSPALMAEDGRRRHDSYSSMTHDQRHYSYSGSAATSPAFGPNAASSYGVPYARSNHSTAGSNLTSPALAPQRDRDPDQEATAALLMLNQDHRSIAPIQRNTYSHAPHPHAPGGQNQQSQPIKKMSVRDLLSS
ncbi:helix-loop-helix dna-binding domain-containing protein [Zalerion maritima]|uniref:Helix-loop-helix dna-binding domain-containing protein n=1 Tax=Zalerion maritima TaxID=339359 RepID=A0AAD5WSN9_9PEZI|nr:helix-loop-helix dna-binding domain-containing protein [Zalerion maritima]